MTISYQCHINIKYANNFNGIIIANSLIKNEIL